LMFVLDLFTTFLLLSQPEALDNFTVSLDVVTLDVIKHFAPTAYHLK